MGPQIDASGRVVPQAFQRAVARFADVLNLAPESLLRGVGFSHEQVVFWLLHHGEADPAGATVLMDVGVPPEQPAALAAMNEHFDQYRIELPAARSAYQGYLPELERLVCCTRIVLGDAEEGAMTIASVVAACTVLKRAMKTACEELKKQPVAFGTMTVATRA
jgi:hypothetical protein